MTDREDFYCSIGARIRNAREKAGYSQLQLAALVGLSRQSISNIERGQQEPGIFTITLIARALGVKLNALMPETPPLLPSEEAEIRAIYKDALPTFPA